MSESASSPEMSPELVSEAIFRFLQLHMLRSADVLPDDAYDMRAGFSEAQLLAAAPLFHEYNVLSPEAIRLGRVTASPRHEAEEADTVASRGYTYAAFEYPERLVAFGGLLTSRHKAHRGEAAKIWRHETSRAAEESLHHGVKKYARVAGNLVSHALHTAGVIRPPHTRPSPDEMALLLRICSL